MDNSLKLPPRLDRQIVRDLAPDLLARRGAPLSLDASEVAFGGALGVQLLVAAQRQWQADGQPFTLVAASDALQEACVQLGVPIGLIGLETTLEGEAVA